MRIGIVSLLFIATLAFADHQKNEERMNYFDYWHDTGFTLEHIRPLLTVETCYKSKTTLYACASAVNDALSVTGNSILLVPVSYIQGQPEIGETLYDLGDARIIAHKPTQEKLKPSAAFKKSKAVIEKLRAAWEALYEKRSIDFSRVYAVIAEKASKTIRIKEAGIAAAALNGFLRITYDPHTDLTPLASLQNELKGKDKQFYGIGVHVGKVEKGLLVIGLEEEGSAAKSGLLPGDVIVRIHQPHGKPVEAGGSADENDLIQLIRGPENTSVTLVIYRETDKKEFTFTITRKKVEQKNVTYKMLDVGKYKIGYVRLRDFMARKGCEEVGNAVLELKSNGMHSLIFDLRSNPGGDIMIASCIASLFLPPKAVIYGIGSVSPEENKNSKEEIQYYTTAPIEVFTQTSPQRPEPYIANPKKFGQFPISRVPMIVLVNGASASASELVSGAFLQQGRAIVLGTTTFGKGSVQAGVDPTVPQFKLPISLPTDVARKLTLKLTIARFYQPRGTTNQFVGIEPEIVVHHKPNPTEEENFEVTESVMFPNALPPVSTTWTNPMAADFADLKACAEKEGSAKARFEKESKGPIVPDYQLYFAEDVWSCVLPLLEKSEANRN